MTMATTLVETDRVKGLEQASAGVVIASHQQAVVQLYQQSSW